MPKNSYISNKSPILKMENIKYYIKFFLVEDLENEIFSILGSALSVKEKMFKLGENYRPRLDYVKADFLIKLYRHEHFSKNPVNKK